MPRWADIPFDSERRYAGSFNHRDGGSLVFDKGAPEQILEMCASAAGRDRLEPVRILDEADEMAKDGLRVLAMGYRDFGPARPGADVLREHPTGLAFLGLQGMMDPPREEARAAVEGCRRAGIRRLAFDAYIHRLAAEITAMTAAMGGLDALVFTGGVGEGSPRVRGAVARATSFLGVAVEPRASRSTAADVVLSSEGASVASLLVSAREDLEIAAQVRNAVLRPGA